jgi:hypothetical protein
MARKSAPNRMGSTIAARCWTIGAVRAPRRALVGSLMARPVATAKRKAWPMIARSLRAVSNRPADSICRRTAKTSGAVIAAIGRGPSAGVARSKSHSALLTVVSDLPSRRFFSRTSRLMASKVSAFWLSNANFPSRFCWLGSNPEANSFLASSRFARASFNPMPGYEPMASLRCLPANR